MDIIQTLAEELNLKKSQVENTIKLIDDGNTIPFIARYRKEMTGEMDETVIRELHERLIYLRNLENRKKEVLRLIDDQGKLTPELEKKIRKASLMQEIEDLYRPFRPKRRTRATIAKEKGLEPLAEVILAQRASKTELDKFARSFIDEEKEIHSEEDALQGARDIIAEIVSDNADYRRIIRDLTFREGILKSKALKQERSEYEDYYDYQEPVRKIPSHRVLAINRGEGEEFLSVKIEAPEDKIINLIKNKLIIKPNPATSEQLAIAVEDAYKRLIAPSIEREIRNRLTETAEEKAIGVFSENLKKLLLQPPIKGRVVIGIDPAYRTGCKVAIVDETGKLLETAVIYPTPPQNETEKAGKIISELIDRYGASLISIGNGTASRETEEFISGLLKEKQGVYYVIVNEAGASVYSASPTAREEFPDLDVSLRGAVSIARRLQDPLAELVKIDPKSIGVGQYQHDVNQKKLGEALNAVVESCVNSVGVDLNTASVSLLKYVAGISSRVAKNIVSYREKHGRFNNRKQLLEVSYLGEKSFEQCAGFLRIVGGENPLDSTPIHPESYTLAEKIIEKAGFKLQDLADGGLSKIREALKKWDIKQLAQELGGGVPTIRDIIEALHKPNRDPRDEMPKPLFRKDVLKPADLKPGMVLKATVRNVVDFGAFVDIGVGQDGLIHISKLSEGYVKNPLDVVSVGDVVDVEVLDVDLERGRISLARIN